MKTKKEFKSEFDSLIQGYLDKYGASLCLESVRGYGYHTEDRMVLTIPSKWDDKGDLIQEYCDFEIDTYMNANKPPITDEE